MSRQETSAAAVEQGSRRDLPAPVGEPHVLARSADSSDVDGRAGPAYYDIPMLKEPTWGWEIASYFFLGGLSAGAFLLARMAERFGGSAGRSIARTGTGVAVAGFLPCTPLLIKDLGDPKRFHYMLRVFKPGTPMNLGAWVLSGYGAALSLAALREWVLAGRVPEDLSSAPARAAETAAAAAADLAGVPLAVMLAGYTGVLLSTSSTPVWARNPWLGPLFSAGALSTGAAAIRLALPEAEAEGPAAEALETIEGASRAAEGVSLAGYLAVAGPQAEPLTTGRYAPHIWAGVVGAGLAAPTVATVVARRSGRGGRWLRMAGAAAALAGGLALRWAVTHAGHESAADPEANRRAGRR